MRKAGHILNYNDVCRNCGGEGYLAGIKGTDMKPVKCETCQGSGMVTIKKEISITITPKTPMYETNRAGH
ncbi:MAG: hypothetical protein N4A71_22135 [Carboxylicivirga sp.]|jgi:DnaJ-class molecular chaperone|nr:hypothetical protein [Carboxylicivirga sp.]